MQIPIVAGIFREGDKLQSAYPINYIPTPKSSGIGNSYLRPSEGLIQSNTGTGNDRGGIAWNGAHYRVSGVRLISVDSVVTNLGDVGGSGPVTLDYGFDRLMIISGGNVYYWNGSLTQITDPDLGHVIDGAWIDGYYMLTDGASLIVTELNDPTSINPIKYGSSEADPDPVVAIKRIRTEVHAINRFTIESFDNVGGELFPFQRIEGATITRGAVGTKAVCIFNDSLAFVGGGRNESIGVYIAANASTKKVSTPDIDNILNAVTNYASVVVESRFDQSHQFIYVHLSDRTLVYDFAASQALEQPVWHILVSGLSGFSQYKARNFVWFNNKWYVGNPSGAEIGYLSDEDGSHWGNKVRREFSTPITYNNSSGAIFPRIELVALVGNVSIDKDPGISTSYSIDGVSWSMPMTIPVGKTGNRNKRLVWLQQGNMLDRRIQRFQHDSDARLTPIMVDAQLEPLAW